MTNKLEALRARAEKVGHLIEFDEQSKDYEAHNMSRLPIEAFGTIEEVAGYINYLEAEGNHCGIDNLDQIYVPVSPVHYKMLKALVQMIAPQPGMADFDIKDAAELTIQRFCERCGIAEEK